MDIVLVGSGVSALLLAESLAARRCFRTLRIVAPNRPLRPQRLSWWSDVPTPFDTSADGSWTTLRVVATDGAEARVPLTRHVYRTMRGQDWIASARARLSHHADITWIDGRADHLETSGNRASAHVGMERIEGDWVFSSARVPGRESDRRQRFEGWEITVDTDRFDPSVATLLDFRTPAAGDFRFLYALPLGPRRLFLEHVSYRPCDHGRFLDSYLRDVLGLTSWSLVERELGQTPIFRDLPVRQHGRVVHIGVAAGLAKPTTGYALTRMWRDAEGIASSLGEHGQPVLDGRPSSLYRVADHLFVDQVEAAPSLLLELVPALFKGASGDGVLAFLDDRARRSEQIEVALTTPRWVRWWLRRSSRLPQPGARHPIRTTGQPEPEE
jgi:lycopene beta-cyclase